MKDEAGQLFRRLEAIFTKEELREMAELVCREDITMSAAYMLFLYERCDDEGKKLMEDAGRYFSGLAKLKEEETDGAN